MVRQSSAIKLSGFGIFHGWSLVSFSIVSIVFVYLRFLCLYRWVFSIFEISKIKLFPSSQICCPELHAIFSHSVLLSIGIFPFSLLIFLFLLQSHKMFSYFKDLFKERAFSLFFVLWFSCFTHFISLFLSYWLFWIVFLTSWVLGFVFCICILKWRLKSYKFYSAI